MHVRTRTYVMSLSFMALICAPAAFGQTIYLQDLGTDFVPEAGNAAGDLVGHRISTNQAAVRRNNGTIIDLGTLGGAQSRATAISDDGTVLVGWAHNANGVQNTFRSLNGGAALAIFFAKSHTRRF